MSCPLCLCWLHTDFSRSIAACLAGGIRDGDGSSHAQPHIAPPPHVNQVLHITGPRALDGAEYAAAFSAALGEGALALLLLRALKLSIHWHVLSLVLSQFTLISVCPLLMNVHE